MVKEVREWMRTENDKEKKKRKKREKERERQREREKERKEISECCEVDDKFPLSSLLTHPSVSARPFLMSGPQKMSCHCIRLTCAPIFSFLFLLNSFLLCDSDSKKKGTWPTYCMQPITTITIRTYVLLEPSFSRCSNPWEIGRASCRERVL